MRKSTISSKGQITVPVEVREQLGLAPGSLVTFEVREGVALLRKGHRGRHPVEAVYGQLKIDGTVDRAIDAMRGPRAGSVRRPGDAARTTSRRKVRTR